MYTICPPVTVRRSLPRHISPIPSTTKYTSSCSWACHGTCPPCGSSVTLPIAKFRGWIGAAPPARFCVRRRAG